MSDHPCPTPDRLTERGEGFAAGQLEYQTQTLDNHNARLMVVWDRDTELCDLFVDSDVSVPEAAALLHRLLQSLINDYNAYTRRN